MSFSSDMRKFALKTKNETDKFVRRVVLGVSESLIQKSPVGDPTYWKSSAPKGYVGGHFRANWQIGVGSIPKGEIEKVDSGGHKTISKIRAGIPKDAAGELYYIINNLPYGPALEDGHSRQAPHGFVGLTLVEYQNIVKGVK